MGVVVYGKKKRNRLPRTCMLAGGFPSGKHLARKAYITTYIPVCSTEFMWLRVVPVLFLPWHQVCLLYVVATTLLSRRHRTRAIGARRVRIVEMQEAGSGSNHQPAIGTEEGRKAQNFPTLHDPLRWQLLSQNRTREGTLSNPP